MCLSDINKGSFINLNIYVSPWFTKHYYIHMIWTQLHSLLSAMEAMKEQRKGGRKKGRNGRKEKERLVFLWLKASSISLPGNNNPASLNTIQCFSRKHEKWALFSNKKLIKRVVLSVESQITSWWMNSSDPRYLLRHCIDGWSYSFWSFSFKQHQFFFQFLKKIYLP